MRRSRHGNLKKYSKKKHRKNCIDMDVCILKNKYTGIRAFLRVFANLTL